MTKGEKKDERLGAEERYKALVETTADAIFALDLLGRFTFVNPAAERISGYSEEELVGKHFRDLLPANYIPTCLNAFQKAIRGQPSPPFEIEMITKEGKRVTLELLGTPVKRGRRVVEIIGIAREITERKRVEETLAQERTLLRALMDNVPDYIYFKDRESRFIRTTKAHAKTFGLSDPTEAIGKTDFEFFSDEHAQQAYADEQNIIKTGKPLVGIEEKETWPDGRETWVSTTKMPLRNEEGQIIGTFGISRDITERKQAQEALRKSEERYKKQFEEAMDAIFIADAETAIIVDCNRVALELVGREKSELVGQHQRILHPPEEIEGEFSRTFKQHLKEKEGQVLEAQVITKKGEIKDVAIKANIFELEGQKMILGIFRDITERKRAEEELRQSEARFRELFDEAPVGYHELDIKGRITGVNRTELDMLGYTAEEMLGRPVWEFMVEKETSRQAFAAKISSTIPPGRAFERTYRRKDGTMLPVLIEDHPLRDESGQIIGLRSTIQDITERKQAEEKLQDEKALMDALMDNIPDSIYFKDRQCRLTRINRTMIRSLGLEEMSQALGKTDIDLYGEEFGRKTLAEDQRIMTTGEPIIGLIESRRLEDEQINWTLTTKVPLRDASGQIVGLVGITREINELMRAQEEIRHRSEELATLHDISLDVTSHLDLNVLLKTTLLRAIELLNANAGGLYLYHPESQELELIVHQGLSKDYTGTRLALGEGLSGKVAQSGEPLLVDDYQRWEGRSPQWEGEAIGGSLGVPLKHGDDLLGVLYIAHAPGNIFQEGDVRLATLFANQAAIAIENARLYQHSTKRLDELSGLYDVSQAFSSMTDVRETFGQLTKRIAQLIGCQICFIATYDQQAREMHAEPPGYGLSDELVRSLHYKVDGPARESWNFRLQGPLLANDITQIPNFFSWWIQSHDLFNLLVVPVSIEGRITGLAYAANKPGGFAQDDMRLLTMFANQAAIAIENARLYGETQKRLAEITALHKVAEIINATLDLKEVFQRVVEELSNAFGYRLVDIYLLEGEALRLQASVGYDAQTTIEAIPLEHGVVGRVARTKEPAFIRDVSQDPDYVPAYPDIISEICVPIKSGETLLGILNVECDKCKYLTENDLMLLDTLSSHIGVAIENARLYGEEQRRSAQRRTIAEVGRKAAAILEMDTLLTQVVDLIGQNFGYYYVNIFQIDPDSDYAVYKAGTGEAGLAILEEGLRLKVGEEGIIGWVAGHDQPLLVNDVGQDPRYYAHPDLPDTRSELAVPIHIGGRITGVLDVQSTELEAFDESDLETLQILADQLAVAMENARLYEETQQLAITDGLTGLYNLRYFYQTLEKEIKRSERYDWSVSLIILDIDDFKVYNDLYGHLAGDDLLKELTQLMSKVTRRTDTLARYGGEEFAIILPETETEEAGFVAERLQEQVREHRFSVQDGQSIGRITISLGVATYPHHADSARTLVDAADKVLLEAKRAGKDRISVYEEELTELEPR